MIVLAGGVVAYTVAEANRFRSRLSRARVHVSPNSLYSKNRIRASEPAEASNLNVVYVGRLVESKKPQLLLEGFFEAVDRGLTEVGLVFVGEGPLEMMLRKRAQELSISDRVSFLGHIGNFEALESVYAQALCAVSPGYVGLSLIQSASFGVPMIIAREEPHAPEIDAAIDGFNCVFFNENSPTDLGANIYALALNRTEWLARRRDIASWCAENYSVEAMAQGLVEAFGHARA